MPLIRIFFAWSVFDSDVVQAFRPANTADLKVRTRRNRDWSKYQKFISRLMWKMLPFAPTGIGYAV